MVMAKTCNACLHDYLHDERARMSSVSQPGNKREVVYETTPVASAGACCRRWITLLTVLWGMTGCLASFPTDPPGPGVPRISQLSLTPEHVQYGCPVTMRFRFEDLHGDIVHAHAYWRVKHSSPGTISHYLLLPIDAAVFAGQTSGEASVQLNPTQYGTTWYSIQVEDAAGRKSNVLDVPILVSAPWPWENKPPECGSQEERR